MKRRTVSIARAHLKAAAAAAMLVQVGLLIGIKIFGANESVFETPRFRLWSATAILALVGTVRIISYVAYARAAATRSAPKDRDLDDPIHRLSGAIVSFLLRLHLGFTGRTVDGQSSLDTKA